MVGQSRDTTSNGRHFHQIQALFHILSEDYQIDGNGALGIACTMTMRAQNLNYDWDWVGGKAAGIWHVPRKHPS